MPKDKKLFSKVMIIILLIMMVLGFSIPLFNLGGEEKKAIGAEPRVCQSDADCYLLCQDQPVTILCSQNLCQQNSCEEFSPVAYQQNPIPISLKIEIEGIEQNLTRRVNPKDSFVRWDDGKVQLYSSQLSLAQILEKFNMGIEGACFKVYTKQYCQDKEHNLTFSINDQEQYLYKEYVPKEGDSIEIKYS